MRKIAIVKYVAAYEDYDSSFCNAIAQHISEWEEVTDEQFGLLKQSLPVYAAKLGHNIRFLVIESPENQKEIIENSVSFYLAKIEEDKKKAEALKAKNARESEEKKRKRELKQLAKLQQRYGVKA